MTAPKICWNYALRLAALVVGASSVSPGAYGQNKPASVSEATITHDEIVDRIGQAWTVFAPELASLAPSARIQAVEKWKQSQAADFQIVAALEAQLAGRDPVSADGGTVTARKLSPGAEQELAAARSRSLSAQERIIRIDAFREKNRAELAASEAAINQEIASHRTAGAELSPAPASPQMAAARAQLDALLLRNVDLDPQQRIVLIDARRNQLQQQEANLTALQKEEIEQSTKTTR